MLDLQATKLDNLPLVINKEIFVLAYEPQDEISTPQLNWVFSTTKKGIWIDKTLEVAMNVVEKRTYALNKASNSWNIPMKFHLDHMNGSINMGSWGVLA